ncbi:MAG: SIMPL domain-containing protein [Haloarculaceae archaeon]
MTRLRYLSVALATLVLLAGCAAVQSPVPGGDAAPAALDGSAATAGPTVQVSASGSVDADPDLAVVYLAVEHTAPTADAARERVATDAERMRAALRSAGVPDANVSTTAFAVAVVYDYTDAGREVDGYRAVHSFRVETAPADAGAIVDAAVGAGATRVDGVQFILSEERRRALRAEALREAVANAESDATALTDAAGVSLGDVASLSTTDVGVSPPGPVYRGDQGASGGSTTLEPGPVTVTAQVHVTYEIA